MERLLEAVAVVPEDSSALCTTVATTCAAVERQLGRYEQAHDRLVRLFEGLPEQASVESRRAADRAAAGEFYRSRYEAMHAWAGRAVDAAKMLGDAALMAVALAMPALADATTGPTDRARSHRAEAAALVDGLSDNELSRRPDAASWLAAARLYLDLYAEADAHASRALGLARATGRGDPLFRLYPILPRIWYVRSWPRPPNSSTARSRPGACSGPRRLSPGTSSTAPSSQSPSAISTSRSPPQRRQSSSRATSTTASSRPGLR